VFDDNSAGNHWQQWLQAFERAEWGVVINRADANTLEVMNAAFARMYGYSIDELRGRPIESIYALEERKNLPGWIDEAHRKGHFSFESRHLRKDGTVFPVSIDVTAVKDNYGKVLYRVVNVQDISQRKAAENALRESEQRNSAIISTLAEGGRLSRCKWGDYTLQRCSRADPGAFNRPDIGSHLHRPALENRSRRWFSVPGRNAPGHGNPSYRQAGIECCYGDL
jgi:PAS domain S-box-containing protein